MDVACGEYGLEVVGYLIAEATGENSCVAFDELETQEKYVTTFWTQFSILTRRNLFTTFQEKVPVPIICLIYEFNILK